MRRFSMVQSNVYFVVKRFTLDIFFNFLDGRPVHKIATYVRNSQISNAIPFKYEMKFVCVIYS